MRPRRGWRLLAGSLGVWLALAVVGCDAGSAGADPPPFGPSPRPASPPVSGLPTATPSPAPPDSPGDHDDPFDHDDHVDQVLAISIDGLNPDAITELGPDQTPAFGRLMREGAWTFNARTEVEKTETLPNHTGMLTGRRVDPDHGGHGVSANVDTGGTVDGDGDGEYVASIFDVAHDRDGSTALYAAKTKFSLYRRTWNTHGRTDRVGSDNGRRKIDRVLIDTDNVELVAAVDAELRRSPRTFTFLHISLPDKAGHRYGFMSGRYLIAVRRTDRLLGDLLATISARPTLRNHLLVILTADHGGEGPNHDDAQLPQNYRIPFMVWGPGVASGQDIYAMNPTFVDPGSSRPGYTGRQPIRNGDLANLATDVLDLPPVPGSELNRPRTLDVFAS